MSLHDLTIKYLNEWTSADLRKERDKTVYEIASKQEYLAEIDRILARREGRNEV